VFAGEVVNTTRALQLSEYIFRILAILDFPASVPRSCYRVGNSSARKRLIDYFFCIRNIESMY